MTRFTNGSKLLFCLRPRASQAATIATLQHAHRLRNGSAEKKMRGSGAFECNGRGNLPVGVIAYEVGPWFASGFAASDGPRAMVWAGFRLEAAQSPSLHSRYLPTSRTSRKGRPVELSISLCCGNPTHDEGVRFYRAGYSSLYLSSAGKDYKVKKSRKMRNTVQLGLSPCSVFHGRVVPERFIRLLRQSKQIGQVHNLRQTIGTRASLRPGTGTGQVSCIGCMRFGCFGFQA